MPSFTSGGSRPHLAKITWAVLCAGGLGLGAATAQTQPAAATPQRGGELIFALNSDPASFDCQATTTYAVLHAVRPLYSGLINFDPETYPDVKPDLAESWEVSDDFKTYTFYLRKGVKFHDGSPLTSEDIKVTFERIVSPPEGVVSVRQARYQDIERIETPDAHTVVFHLSRPNPAMLQTFASPWNCVVSAEKVKQDPRWPERNILGTGAFKFVDYTPGSMWRAERFDDYFQPDKPYLDGYRILFMKDAAMTNGIQGGQIHTYFVSMNPSQYGPLKAAMGDRVEVQSSPYLCKHDIFFNHEKPPFNDPRVRQALNLAVDRWGGAQALSRITNVKHVGGALRPGGPFAIDPQELEKLPGFSKDVKASREQAKQLLADANASNLSFKLTTRNLQSFTPLVIFLTDQWRQIGVKVEPEPLPVSQQKASYMAGNYTVGLDANCYEADEPNDQLALYISHDRSPINFSRYHDEELDALYDEQKAALTPEEREAAIRAFETRLINEAMTVPLAWWERNVVLSSNVKGWKALPSQYLNQDLTDVWLEKP